MNTVINKVMVVGNAAGGKTLLSRRLSQLHGLPVTHVDSIQFTQNMQIRPLPETREILKNIESQGAWLIDGFGPFDLIEKRFVLADRIVFIDLPLWRHSWWLLKRQMKSLWAPRAELPSNNSETNWAHTVKVFKTMKSIHRQMRPELIKIFNRDSMALKVTHITTLKQWNKIYFEGLH